MFILLRHLLLGLFGHASQPDTATLTQAIPFIAANDREFAFKLHLNNELMMKE